VECAIDQWPSYLAYLVSFVTSDAAWFGHRLITEYLDRATSVPLSSICCS
jgi:uncharacterized membrane protein